MSASSALPRAASGVCASERALCYVGALWCVCVPGWILRVCGVLLVTQSLWLPCAQELRARAAAALASGAREWVARGVECAFVVWVGWLWCVSQ